MKKRKHISAIRFLMISSQILLSLFLVYWLSTQYSENKNLLKKELQRELRQAEQQVIDSMLSSQLIDPILGDTKLQGIYMLNSNNEDTISLSSEYAFSSDSVGQIVMQIEKNQNNTFHLPSSADSGSYLNITIGDSIGHSDSIVFNHSIQDTSNKLLLQSIRLLISSVEKVNPEDQGLSTFFISTIDTALLKSLFYQFLLEKYPGFSVYWVSGDQIDFDQSVFSEILLQSALFEKEYNAVIQQYSTYLLKSISPQIIFALILLLITTLAFRTAYMSLKSQHKLLHLKNDFISNITHELKTPVSTVKVALEALLDFDMKTDPNRTKEYLEMAHSEMNRLDLLVNQVLNNSALEDGRPFVNLESVDLIKLMEKVLFSMQSRFEQVDAIIHFKPTEESLIITADKFHIHGVLVNLLDNSLKYCQKKPEIKLNIKQNADETILVLEDNGIGIPEEYLDKIFEKFFRVPNENRHNVKGYGLGLNYASLVMKQHHGFIKVKNLEEGGCQFALVFPSNK